MPRSVRLYRGLTTHPRLILFDRGFGGRNAFENHQTKWLFAPCQRQDAKRRTGQTRCPNATRYEDDFAFTFDRSPLRTWSKVNAKSSSYLVAFGQRVCPVLLFASCRWQGAKSHFVWWFSNAFLPPSPRSNKINRG